MASDAGSSTNPTLLGRLKLNPTDQSAWGEFVDRYGRKIFRWCRQGGLQEADAEDVTQGVLLDLARQMREFTYDPAGSFRAWLKLITRRAWQKFQMDRQTAGSGDSAVQALLSAEPAGEDLSQQMEDECDRELMEHAMARVRLRVQPHIWQAFHLLALEDCSGSDAAAQLGMKVSHVFTARSRVQKMIRTEVGRLDKL